MPGAIHQLSAAAFVTTLMPCPPKNICRSAMNCVSERPTNDLRSFGSVKSARADGVEDLHPRKLPWIPKKMVGKGLFGFCEISGGVIFIFQEYNVYKDFAAILSTSRDFRIRNGSQILPKRYSI